MTDIYETLHKRGLTTSKRHFATYWCSRAPNYLSICEMSADAMICVFRKLMAQRKWLTALTVARTILLGTRKPKLKTPVAPFNAPYKVDLIINFNSAIDDQRRIAAENWCMHNIKGAWFRRVLTRIGVARFEFEDAQEAALFRTFHP